MSNYTMWSEEDYVLMLLPQTDRYVWLLINNACICHFSYKLVNLLITSEMLFLSVLSQDRSFNQVSTPESILYSKSRRQ